MTGRLTTKKRGYMTIENIKDKIGDYAKDVRINISNVLTEGGSPDLTLKQIFGTALASAYATKNKDLVAAIIAEAGANLDEAEINGAKSAASIMGMNNIYYRFVHLVEDKEYSSMPAGLRMQVIANSGIDKVNFEIYSLAVSAINGCGMCMEAHVKTSEKHGVTKKGVQSAVKIASVINSAAQALAIAEI
jgi:alkyl hydroperoxide reductase subunit D